VSKEFEPVVVSTVQSGQLWQSEETGDKWLVTKVYVEAFASFAILRKVGGTDADLLRVKIESAEDGVSLPGFIFTQYAEDF